MLYIGKPISRLLKITSTLLVVSLGFTQTLSADVSTVLFGSPKVRVSDSHINTADFVRTLSLAENIGRVEEVYQGKKDEFVVLIRDAHMNYPAQKNIASIIDNLVTQHGFRLVGQEGGEGSADTTLLRAFPVREVTRRVLERYVKKGELGGPEFQALTGDTSFDFVGVEKEKSYRENLSQFMRVLDIREDGKALIRSVHGAMKSLQDTAYTANHRDFNTAYARFRRNQTDLLLFLKTLQASAAKTDTDLSRFKNIKAILEMSATPASQMPELDPADLFSEIDALVFALRTKFARSKTERELVALEEFLFLYARGLDLECSRADAARLETLSRYFRAEKLKRFLKDASAEYRLTVHSHPINAHSFDDFLARIITFYQTARTRDRILFTQLRKEMALRNVHSAVLVSGGFHTEGVASELRRKNASYVILTPHIDEFSSDHQARYLRLMERNADLLRLKDRSTINPALIHPNPELRSRFLYRALPEVASGVRSERAEVGRLFAESLAHNGVIELSDGRVTTPRALIEAAARFARRDSDASPSKSARRNALVSSVLQGSTDVSGFSVANSRKTEGTVRTNKTVTHIALSNTVGFGVGGSMLTLITLTAVLGAAVSVGAVIFARARTSEESYAQVMAVLSNQYIPSSQEDIDDIEMEIGRQFPHFSQLLLWRHPIQWIRQELKIMQLAKRIALFEEIFSITHPRHNDLPEIAKLIFETEKELGLRDELQKFKVYAGTIPGDDPTWDFIVPYRYPEPSSVAPQDVAAALKTVEEKVRVISASGALPVIRVAGNRLDRNSDFLDAIESQHRFADILPEDIAVIDDDSPGMSFDSGELMPAETLNLSTQIADGPSRTTGLIILNNSPIPERVAFDGVPIEFKLIDVYEEVSEEERWRRATANFNEVDEDGLGTIELLDSMTNLQRHLIQDIYARYLMHGVRKHRADVVVYSEELLKKITSGKILPTPIIPTSSFDKNKAGFGAKLHNRREFLRAALGLGLASVVGASGSLWYTYEKQQEAVLREAAEKIQRERSRTVFTLYGDRMTGADAKDVDRLLKHALENAAVNPTTNERKLTFLLELVYPLDLFRSELEARRPEFKNMAEDVFLENAKDEIRKIYNETMNERAARRRAMLEEYKTSQYSPRAAEFERALLEATDRFGARTVYVEPDFDAWYLHQQALRLEQRALSLFFKGNESAFLEEYKKVLLKRSEADRASDQASVRMIESLFDEDPYQAVALFRDSSRFSNHHALARETFKTDTPLFAYVSGTESIRDQLLGRLEDRREVSSADYLASFLEDLFRPFVLRSDMSSIEMREKFAPIIERIRISHDRYRSGKTPFDPVEDIYQYLKSRAYSSDSFVTHTIRLAEKLKEMGYILPNETKLFIESDWSRRQQHASGFGALDESPADMLLREMRTANPEKMWREAWRATVKDAKSALRNDREFQKKFWDVARHEAFWKISWFHFFMLFSVFLVIPVVWFGALLFPLSLIVWVGGEILYRKSVHRHATEIWREAVTAKTRVLAGQSIVSELNRFFEQVATFKESALPVLLSIAVEGMNLVGRFVHSPIIKKNGSDQLKAVLAGHAQGFEDGFREIKKGILLNPKHLQEMFSREIEETYFSSIGGDNRYFLAEAVRHVLTDGSSYLRTFEDDIQTFDEAAETFDEVVKKKFYDMTGDVFPEELSATIRRVLVKYRLLSDNLAPIEFPAVGREMTGFGSDADAFLEEIRSMTPDMVWNVALNAAPDITSQDQKQSMGRLRSIGRDFFPLPQVLFFAVANGLLAWPVERYYTAPIAGFTFIGLSLVELVWLVRPFKRSTNKDTRQETSQATIEWLADVMEQFAHLQGQVTSSAVRATLINEVMNLLERLEKSKIIRERGSAELKQAITRYLQDFRAQLEILRRLLLSSPDYLRTLFLQEIGSDYFSDTRNGRQYRFLADAVRSILVDISELFLSEGTSAKFDAAVAEQFHRLPGNKNVYSPELAAEVRGMLVKYELLPERFAPPPKTEETVLAIDGPGSSSAGFGMSRKDKQKEGEGQSDSGLEARTKSVGDALLKKARNPESPIYEFFKHRSVTYFLKHEMMKFFNARKSGGEDGPGTLLDENDLKLLDEVGRIFSDGKLSHSYKQDVKGVIKIVEEYEYGKDHIRETAQRLLDELFALAQASSPGTDRGKFFKELHRQLVRHELSAHASATTLRAFERFQFNSDGRAELAPLVELTEPFTTGFGVKDSGKTDEEKKIKKIVEEALRLLAFRTRSSSSQLSPLVDGLIQYRLGPRTDLISILRVANESYLTSDGGEVGIRARDAWDLMKSAEMLLRAEPRDVSGALADLDEVVVILRDIHGDLDHEYKDFGQNPDMNSRFVDHWGFKQGGNIDDYLNILREVADQLEFNVITLLKYGWAKSYVADALLEALDDVTGESSAVFFRESPYPDSLEFPVPARAFARLFQKQMIQRFVPPFENFPQSLFEDLVARDKEPARTIDFFYNRLLGESMQVTEPISASATAGFGANGGNKPLVFVLWGKNKPILDEIWDILGRQYESSFLLKTISDNLDEAIEQARQEKKALVVRPGPTDSIDVAVPLVKLEHDDQAGPYLSSPHPNLDDFITAYPVDLVRSFIISETPAERGMVARGVVNNLRLLHEERLTPTSSRKAGAFTSAETEAIALARQRYLDRLRARELPTQTAIDKIREGQRLVKANAVRINIPELGKEGFSLSSNDAIWHLLRRGKRVTSANADAVINMYLSAPHIKAFEEMFAAFLEVDSFTIEVDGPGAVPFLLSDEMERLPYSIRTKGEIKDVHNAFARWMRGLKTSVKLIKPPEKFARWRKLVFQSWEAKPEKIITVPYGEEDIPAAQHIWRVANGGLILNTQELTPSGFFFQLRQGLGLDLDTASDDDDGMSNSAGFGEKAVRVAPIQKAGEPEIIRLVDREVSRDAAEKAENVAAFKTVVVGSSDDLNILEGRLNRYAPEVRRRALSGVRTVTVGWDVLPNEEAAILKRLSELFPDAARRRQIHVRENRKILAGLGGGDIDAVLLGHETDYLINTVQNRFILERMQDNRYRFLQNLGAALEAAKLAEHIYSIAA